MIKIKEVIQRYGFRFAKAVIQMTDYRNEKELDVILLLDTLVSEKPALTYEQYQQLNKEVGLDYKGEKERLHSLIVDQDEETKVKIFKKYEELLEKLKGYENLDITLSEYPVGFTTITDGLISNKDLTVKEGRVASSFIGKADLLGRLDDVPIVIELKTGKKHPGDLTEAELYALGVSKRLNAKEVIVLHIYVNEEKDEPNERRFGEDEFDSIEKKFESFAEKIATWNPNDALSPDYSLGDWCNYCEFQETCAEFR